MGSKALDPSTADVAAIKRIIVTGPESSGKTSLVRLLAKHHAVPWVDEYARAYFDGRSEQPYTLSDLEVIAQAQLKQIEAGARSAAAQNCGFLLVDTGLEVIRIWAEDKFGTCPQSINEGLQRQRAHGYLLFAPDLEWEPDPLREDPGRRDVLFERYKVLLGSMSRPFRTVRGRDQTRRSAAENALQELLLEPAAS
jgi:nicotinamide riboside kinase